MGRRVFKEEAAVMVFASKEEIQEVFEHLVDLSVRQPVETERHAHTGSCGGEARTEVAGRAALYTQVQPEA